MDGRAVFLGDNDGLIADDHETEISEDRAAVPFNLQTGMLFCHLPQCLSMTLILFIGIDNRMINKQI